VRYRLPEELVGVDYAASSIQGGVATFEIPGVGRVMLPAESLTEVAPPLPPEPPVGSVVRAQAPGRESGGRWVFEHTDDGVWYTTAHDRPYEWRDLRAGAPVLLVPDPFGEPVELPWRCNGVEVQQTRSDTGPGHLVHVSTKGASYGFDHLPPDRAREMARALWAAANAAEVAS
jgi:hypothetical protein